MSVDKRLLIVPAILGLLGTAIAIGMVLGPRPGTCLSWDGIRERTVIAVVVRSFTEPRMELVTAAGEAHVKQSVCEDLCR